MISTLAPSPAQNARSFSVASLLVPSGGVRMHQRLMKSSAKPESGPECSVPATGCAGTKWTPAGICGDISRTMAPLTEPTSETMAPDFGRHRAAGADGDAEDDEVGIFHGFDIDLDHAVDNAELLDAGARLLRARGGDDLARETLRAGGTRDRAPDQAEADQRDAF